jgi:hypothetical protein
MPRAGRRLADTKGPTWREDSGEPRTGAVLRVMHGLRPLWTAFAADEGGPRPSRDRRRTSLPERSGQTARSQPGTRRGPAFRAHGHPPLRTAGSLHFDGTSSGSGSVPRGTHRVFVPVASRSRVLGRDDAGEPAVRIPPATDTLGCRESLVRYVEECEGVFPTEGS